MRSRTTCVAEFHPPDSVVRDESTRMSTKTKDQSTRGPDILKKGDRYLHRELQPIVKRDPSENVDKVLRSLATSSLIAI